MKTVIRHPFEQFLLDSLGETTIPVFGSPQPVTVDEVSPGASIETGHNLDDTVTSSCQLLLRPPPGFVSSPHDEWTVDGLRWQQTGEPARWPLGLVITLTRRTG